MVDNWFLLIDGANMLISSAFALREMRTAALPGEIEGKPTGGVFGMFYRLREIIWEHHDHTAIVVWDGGSSHRRKRLYPKYKAQRSDKDDGILAQFPLARALCSNMGIVNLRVRGVEADDVIAFLARHSHRALIYSSDRDFMQLVTDRVGVVRSPRDPIVTGKNLLESIKRVYKTPYTSTGMLRLAYGLAGDPGDNVQGIAGVGHKKAFDILTQYADENHGLPPVDSDHEALRLMCGTDRRKVWRRVSENWDDFLLAMELTDLHRDDLLTPQEVSGVLSQLRTRSQLFQLDRFITLVRELELPDVLDRIGFLTYAMMRRCKEIDTRALL
jgi:5'-3' exonuclease